MVVTENNKISSENIGQFLGENIEREQVKGHSIGQNAPFNRGMLAFDNHMISGIRPGIKKINLHAWNFIHNLKDPQYMSFFFKFKLRLFKILTGDR